MAWEKLNAMQQAYLQLNATYYRDTIRNGKVIRGDVRNAKAQVLQAQKAITRDQDRARDKRALTQMLTLVANTYTVPVRQIEAGRARGAGELTRKRAGAMRMGFYKGTSFGS